MSMHGPATLKELSDHYAKKQPHEVDTVTEETPILARIKWEEASHGLWNAYEEVNDVKGAGLVEMNSLLPMLGVASELKKIDLNIFGGEMECPEDKAQLFGDKTKYFAKKMPKILRQSGMGAEKAILYSNLRRYALDHKGMAMDAGGSGDKLYSIIALRQVPGETIGLYSPHGFSGKGLFNTTPISNGGPYKNKDGVLVYGVRLKAYFGYQIGNPQTVAAIVNIDADHLPEPEMIDDLLANVRATSASTMLLMHPRLKTMLNKHKATHLQTETETKNLGRSYTHWDGIELLSSYNFEDGTEKRVAVKG